MTLEDDVKAIIESLSEKIALEKKYLGEEIQTLGNYLLVSLALNLALCGLLVACLWEPL